MEKGKEKHLKKGKRHPDQSENFFIRMFCLNLITIKRPETFVSGLFLKEDPCDVW